MKKKEKYDMTDSNNKKTNKLQTVKKIDTAEEKTSQVSGV